jgi:hypothetical protein
MEALEGSLKQIDSKKVDLDIVHVRLGRSMKTTCSSPRRRTR